MALVDPNRLDPQSVLVVAHQGHIIQAARQVGLKTCQFGAGERVTNGNWQVGHYGQLLTRLRQTSQKTDESWARFPDHEK